ncbi:MAG: ubiquinol-cytochrome c reductase iron-sulfur subunit [Acidobacteria bacterium]|nr:ubiquinol-cytochrome c reductase iron-sulfur subunit [Acidobacteriota bacterium]
MRLDPEPLPRRDWLGLASLWSAASALAFGFIGAMRLPKAAVVAAPSKALKLTLPESLPAGEAFVPPGRAMAVFRDGEGVYAISTICTHLGCVVKPNAEGFECPCHGSRFDHAGGVVKGPAPRALPWLQVRLANGEVHIDEGKTVPSGTKAKQA